MADTEDTISFANAIFMNSAGAQSTLNGTLTVDYTTGAVTGSLVSSSGTTFSGFSAVANSGGSYSFTGTGGLLSGGLLPSLTVAYPNTSQAPATVNLTATSLLGVVVTGSHMTDGVAVASAAIPCFCTGTLIRTARGNVAVEDLAIGDLVVTASGEHRPICWIGHQTHRCQGAMQPRSLWPVRVAEGTFGDNRPFVDLFLSPGHSVCLTFVDEVLVPVQELVNGSTIAYIEVDEVTYWHVELDSHDILIANGLPAESFLEMGANRAAFQEGLGRGDPSEDVVGRTHACFCRRFVDRGPLLEALRAELRLRAERLGWRESRSVAIAATTHGRALAPLRREGEAIFALPPGSAIVTLRSDVTMPALMGLPDRRRLGLAIYVIELIDADGKSRRLDVDASDMAAYFHAGERDEGLHYRYTSGDLVLPSAATEGLTEPVMLRLLYEPSTLRGWTAPKALRDPPTLRIVA